LTDHVLILGEWHLCNVLTDHAGTTTPPAALGGLQQKLRGASPGHAPDITARIERGRVVGGLISEYRRTA